MILSKSPETLNFYLNHSAIHPNIAPDGTGYIDGSDVLARDDTFFFVFSGGALLFFREDGVFKGDIYFLPRHRGAVAKHAAAKSLEYMFRVTDRIIVEVPDFNKASQRFIGSLGFNRVGVNPDAWAKDGVSYDVIVYEVKNEQYR